MIDFEEGSKHFSKESENMNLSEDEIRFKIKEDICLSMLNESNYDFRTETALKKESEMTGKEFEIFLKNHPEVHKSDIPSNDGDNLYRLGTFGCKY